MATAIAKVCKVCGTDVSTAKRTKNAAGEYFCQPCNDSLRHSASPPPSTPRPAPTTAEVPPAPVLAAPDPKRLAPGEYDAFFDHAVLALLQRQVSPEPLLMVCDMASGGDTRTFLLTPSKLICVTLKRNAGLMSVADCRDLPLDQIESLEVAEKPQKVGRKVYQISFLSKDGLERWETVYSSGRRIVEAAKLLQEGGRVDPFIRTTDDLAASNAAKSIWQQPMNVIVGMAVDHIKKRVTPITAVMIGMSLVCGVVAIWGVVTLTALLFSGPPAGHSSTVVSQQSEEQQKQDKAKQAVVDFMNRWVGAPATVPLDSRAVPEVRKAVDGIRLSRFDGTVSSLGDNTITVVDTGNQYPVYDFEVRPVISLGSQFVPVTIKLSVAKDSNKVISVMSSQF